MAVIAPSATMLATNAFPISSDAVRMMGSRMTLNNQHYTLLIVQRHDRRCAAVLDDLAECFHTGRSADLIDPQIQDAPLIYPL